MPTYTFHKAKDINNEFDHSTVKITTDTESLDDILEAAEAFIRACGFSAKGNLEFVPEEGATDVDTE